MEKTISLSTERSDFTTNLKIDNTTDFKSFDVTALTGEKLHKKASIMILKENDSVTVDLNGVVLHDLEINMLLKFLKQIHE